MLKSHILRILSGAPTAGMIISAVKVELSARLGQRPGDAEFRDAVADLVAATLLGQEKDLMTGDPVIYLTSLGRKTAERL